MAKKGGASLRESTSTEDRKTKASNLRMEIANEKSAKGQFFIFKKDGSAITRRNHCNYCRVSCERAVGLCGKCGRD